MKQVIRILYIDDYPLDRELVRHALEKEHGGFELIEATSRADFESNLARGGFDLVLSDFNILGFEGLQVLEAVQAKNPDLPVIIVTGTGSEEVAVEAIKRGASDYVIKTPKHIQLLPHLIHDTLDKKRLETEKRRAEEAFKQTHDLLTNLARLVPGVIYQYRLYPDGRSAFPYSSPGMNDIYEYSPEEVREDATPVFSRLHPDDYEMVSKAIFESARTLEEFYCEFRVILPKQGLRWRWSQAHPERTPDGGTLWHGIISDITERKEAEDALKESDSLYRKMIENSPLGMHFYKLNNNDQLVFVGANPAANNLLGVDHLQFVGKKIEEAFPALVQTEVPARYRDAAALGIPWSTEQITYEDEQIAGAFEVSAFQTMPGKMVAVFANIARRKQAEEALRVSETRFRTLFEHAPAGVALVETKTGRYLDINPKYCDFLGYTREEAKTMSFQDVSHPDKLQENLDKNKALLEGKIREFSLEKRFICKDGTIKWGFLTASPLWGKDETPAQYIHIAVVQDITERKQAEKLQKTLYGIAQAADQAQSLNSLYSAIHSSIQDAMPADNFYIALYDEKNDLISFPYAIGEENSKKQPRKPGRGLTEYVLRTAKPALVDEALEKQLQERGEIEMVGVPSPIWLGVPLIVAGKAIGVMVVQDYKNARAYGDREKELLEFVSSQVAVAIERKQAEEKLLASETRYRRLFEAARDGILILEYETGQVVDVNPFLTEMLGVAKQEIIGKELWELGFFKDITANKKNYLELIEKEYIRYHDLPMEKKDGKRFYVEFVSNVYQVNHDKVVQCNIRDITARKVAEDEIKQLNATLEKRVEERTRELRETQEKLVRQERLAVLGQLAGGVAHELRNPLGVISNSIYYLNLIQPDAEEKVKTYHTMIEHEVNTAEKIISGLLGFSRNVAADLEPVSIPEIFRGVLQRYPAPASIRLELIFPPSLPMITADPHHMDTILGNLIVNAYQAMVLPKTGSSADVPAGGTLTVSARRIKNMVEIAVKDTGTGVSPENMKRLFEPLFTTKLTGIGLGLAVSKRLVEANNGRIEVESKVGKGTTFTLIFPAHVG